MAEKIVVALVPGIFASYLYDRSGKSPGWHVNPKVALGYHACLTSPSQRTAFSHPDSLVAEGPASKAPAGIDANRGWQNVFLDSYLPFLQACQAGADRFRFDPLVYAIGYNFALSNEITASRDIAYALNRIFTRHKTDPDFKGRFFFVTHSMGALVVRRMLQTFGNLLGTCLGVIHVAAPNAGAPEALMRFIRGMQSDKKIVERIFGNTGWKVCTGASTIGAGFQLLPYPMQDAVFTAVRPPSTATRDDPFFLRQIASTLLLDKTVGESEAKAKVTYKVNGAVTNEESFPNNGNPLWGGCEAVKDAVVRDMLHHLEAARRFHDQLDAMPLFPQTVAVALTGKDTVQKVRITFDSGSRLTEADETTTTDGDGTVPFDSQTFRLPQRTTNIGGREFAALRTVRGVSHEAALKSPEVVDHVIDLLDKFHPRPGIR